MIPAIITALFVGIYVLVSTQFLLGFCAAAKKEVPRLTRWNPTIVKL